MDRSIELKTNINNYIFEMLKTEDFKNNFSQLINTAVIDLIFNQKEQFFKSEIYSTFQKKVRIEILNTINSANFRKNISSIIESNLTNIEKSNKTLDSIIPPAIVNSLKVYIYNHKDDIVRSIKTLLNNKDIEKKIYTEINNSLNGLNPMVARFINMNNIFIKIKSSIDDYLNDAKNIREIVNFICSQIDTFMKKRISELSNYFPVEGRKSIINSLTQTVSTTLLSEDLINSVLTVLEDKFTQALSELDNESTNFNYTVNTFVSNFIKISYDQILEMDTTKMIVSSLAEGIVDNILSKPIIDLL